MNTLEENFRLFSVYTNTLRIFGLIRLKSDESLIDKILANFPLTLFTALFLWCLIKLENPLIFSKDYVATYCQLIYHIGVLSCIVVVLLETLIFPKCHLKILELFAEIDETLIKSFKLPINYKKWKILNYLIASPNIIVIITIVSRALSTRGSLFYFAYYAGLAAATFIFCVMESFYNAIAIQIYLRLNEIEKLLKSQKFGRTELINGIFVKVFYLIESINYNFGLFIVAATGKIGSQLKV